MEVLVLLGVFMFAVPAFGVNVNLLYLISLLFIIRWKINKQRLKIYLFNLALLSPLVIVLLVYPSKWLTLVVLFAAITTSLYDKYNLKELKVVLYALAGATIVSYISLFILGHDLLPLILYGESRHSVGAFQGVNYRPSGFYLEPSTLAYHFLLLAFLFDLLSRRNKRNLDKYIRASIILSFLTLSPASLVGLVFLKKFKIKKLRYRAPLIVTSFIMLYTIINLLLYKLEVYSGIGFASVERFKALHLAFKEEVAFGLSITEISNFVIYDNGPIISLILYFGYLSIPIILFLLYVVIKDWRFLALLLIKIPFTNPLLWMVATTIIVYGRNNSTQQVRIS